MVKVDYAGWASQTSFGEETGGFAVKPANTNTPFGKVIDCAVEADLPLYEHRDRSDGRNVADQIPGRVKCAGPVEFHPQNGLFLKYALGELKKGAKGNGTTTPTAADDNNEVISGCNIEEQATPDMTVKLAASGSYDISGSNYTTTALASISIGAADPTNPRVDVISIKDNAGTTQSTITAGTPAANPVPDWASVPTDELVIALAYVAAGTTSIKNGDIKNIFWIKEANDIPSISIEDDYLNPDGSGSDDLIQIFLGCKVNELTYSVSRGQTEPVKFVANFIGKKPQTNPAAPGTASTITDYAGDKFLEWNTVINIAGSTDYYLTDFSFGINNHLKDHGTDGRFMAALLVNEREYTATAKMNLRDTEDIEKGYGAAGATEPQETLNTFTIKHTLKKPSYEFIEFTFSNCGYKKVKPEAPLDDATMQNIEISMRSCQIMLVEGTEVY